LKRIAGFTLLELLVVLAIIALGSAGVGFAMRDSAQTRLEREALRLGALLESARAHAQVGGAAVRWRTTATGFRFDGLPATQSEPDLPRDWLDADTRARIERAAGGAGQTAKGDPEALLLGPDPIIEPQAVTLYSASQPEQRVRLATDGVRPFAVQAGAP
jgi:general secretion pathway protein H